MAESDFEKQRWRDLDNLLTRTSPLANPDFTPSAENLHDLHKKNILVIGAGGLGCELLKDLALSGFKKMSVIDLDTIDVSNLNRQFLFRQSDIGKPKAECAARFVMDRVPGVEVTPYCCKIQDKPTDFYRQFDMIITGLDSVEARRWINALVVDLAEVDEEGNVDFSTIIPIIDGGTEGFKGQSRVILPRLTACFECTLDLYPPQVVFQSCTIANTPRLPEHCIQYVSDFLWQPAFGDTKLNGDNPEHVKWCYEQALARAEANNIQGVTYRLTQGVIKNIIPAIASTNAIIAAACANEALKLATDMAGMIQSYVMYMGAEGIYTHTYFPEKKEQCLVCSQALFDCPISREATLEDPIKKLMKQPKLRMKTPSLRCGSKSLFIRGPLEEATRPHLTMALKDLLPPDNATIVVTDPALPVPVTVNLIFEAEIVC